MPGGSDIQPNFSVNCDMLRTKKTKTYAKVDYYVEATPMDLIDFYGEEALPNNRSGYMVKFENTSDYSAGLVWMDNAEFDKRFVRIKK